MKELNLKKTLRKIVIFTCCMTVLLVGVAFALSYMYVTTFNNATEERLHEEVNNYKERIVRQIDRKFQVINSMAALIGVDNMPEKEDFKESFQTAATQNSFLILGYWDAVQDTVVVATEDDKLKEMPKDQIQVEIQEVLNDTLQGKNVVSKAFRGELSKKEVFVMGTPVYHDGEIIGAILAGDTVDAFSRVLEEQREFYGSGYTHLIDSEGKFIVRSDEAAVKEDVTSILGQPYMDESEAETIKQQMENEEVIHFHFIYDNQKYNTLLEPLHINGWYLFCVNSIQNVNQNIYKLMYAAAGFFILTVALFFFTLRYGYSTMKKLNQKLQKMAYYDELTGIYNMRYFTKLASKEAETQEGYSIMVLNVRHFKFVNEFFRREEADNILKNIGQILQSNVRDGEYACRENSDYFYLFLKDLDYTVLEERFNEICGQISGASQGSDRGFRIVMRCGVATSKTGSSLRDVLLHAMFALARTKEDHKRDIWFFNTELHELEQKDNYIENNARRALENGEFKLYLQPKVNLKDDSLTGAEALVRWVEDNGNTMYPGEFIPLFEKNGFCTAMDMYMFEKVCQQLRAWIDAGYKPVQISINQSKLTFYKRDYMEKLRYYLEKYKVPASLITLEVLEGFAVDNVEEMNRRLEALKEIGFQISMDDFGSGYSSLNVLGKLQLDEVKLDRGFLLEAIGNEGKKTRVIMEEVLRMTKRLSISTVVEGIETDQDEEFVKAIGGDIGQGYLYSKPVSAEVFTADILLTSSLNSDFSGGGQNKWPHAGTKR